MKNINVCIVIFLFLLSSCGGGGSSASSTANTVGTSTNNQKSVSHLEPPTIEECDRITSDSLTVDDLDLSGTQSQLINDMLLIVDPENTYQLFLKNHDNLIAWMKQKNVSFEVALHETNHHINYQIDFCDAYDSIAIFSEGQFYPLGFWEEDTERNMIVSETIPESFKSSHYYELYIEKLNHRFDSLLGEFNSYNIEIVFYLKFLASALPSNDAYKLGLFQINGTVNFMVFTQYYLKSLRENYPETYAIVNQPDAREFIQHLWRSAERILVESYQHLSTPGDSYELFFNSDTGISFLKQAYSEEALTELDSLGISHMSYADWQDTYFQDN